MHRFMVSSTPAAVVAKLNATPGGIGYADVADVPAPSGSVTNSRLRNGADTDYVPPGALLASNCEVLFTVPGLSSSDAVGQPPPRLVIAPGTAPEVP